MDRFVIFVFLLSLVSYCYCLIVNGIVIGIVVVIVVVIVIIIIILFI